VGSVEEALELANITEYGLGSNVWTTDPASSSSSSRGSRPAWCSSTAPLPPIRAALRRIKASGYGRELGSHGIKEFCNAKTVWVGLREEGDAGQPGSRTD